MEIELLTPQQVAEKLGVTETTLTAWRHHGRYDLPYLKLGRKVMYRKSDIESWLEERLCQN